MHYAALSSPRRKGTELQQPAFPSPFRKRRFRDLGIFPQYPTLHPVGSALFYCIADGSPPF
mgnify:CR=1